MCILEWWFYFLGVNFEHVLKMVVTTKFIWNFLTNIASKRKSDNTRTMIFFKVNFQKILKTPVKPNFYVPNKAVYEEKNTLMFLIEYHFSFLSINSTCFQQIHSMVITPKHRWTSLAYHIKHIFLIILILILSMTNS